MVHFLRRVKDDRFTKYLFGRLVDLETETLRNPTGMTMASDREYLNTL